MPLATQGSADFTCILAHLNAKLPAFFALEQELQAFSALNHKL